MQQFWRAIFSALAVFFYTSEAMELQAAFAIGVKGYRLDGHSIHETQSVTSVFDCASLCFSKVCFGCKSINYEEKATRKGGKMCQLSNETKVAKPGRFVPDPAFNYYEPRTITLSSLVSSKTCLGEFTLPLAVGNKSYFEQLMKWLPPGRSWKLCYRASRDGTRPADFHKRCDFKGETVTVIHTEKYIFGGYSDQEWGGTSRWIKSTKSFIFSLRNNADLEPFKCPVYQQHSDKAMYTNKAYGPTFGEGFDMAIYSQTGDNGPLSKSKLGRTYRLPHNYTKTDKAAKQLLAGESPFGTSEVEVFYWDKTQRP